MIEVVLVGLASGVLALAISRGSVFAPVRARLTGWAAELASCYLCLGAWLSAALMVLQGVPDGLSSIVAWGAAWGIGTALAAAVDRMAGVDEGEREEHHASCVRWQ